MVNNNEDDSLQIKMLAYEAQNMFYEECKENRCDNVLESMTQQEISIVNESVTLAYKNELTSK